MRLVLNEWVAATVQLHFGKATPENDAKFYAFVQVRVCVCVAVFKLSKSFERNLRQCFDSFSVRGTKPLVNPTRG